MAIMSSSFVFTTAAIGLVLRVMRPFKPCPCGEVMGIDVDFARAYAKAQLGAGVKLPMSGRVFISVRDADKKHVVETAKKLYDNGFELVATRGTSAFLQEKGIPVNVVNKVLEGRPHVVDAIKNNEICMVINTTQGAQAVADSFSIRRNTRLIVKARLANGANDLPLPVKDC